MRKRQQSLLARAAEFRQRILDDDIRICFGSRRRFNAQHHLAKNGFDHHADWAQDWQDARSSQFFVLGSKDEAGGNQGCTLIREDDGQYALRLRMPADLADTHGRYVYLTGLTFPYRPEIIETARIANLSRERQKAAYRLAKQAGTTTLSEGQFLAEAGQALSYRFVRDRKGCRILVTTNLVAETAIPDTSAGVIGVDFNADHLAIAELDRAGHKVALDRIPLADHQATSRQNRTQLEAAAKQIVDLAVATGKPVVIEKLNFRGKKAGLQKKESGQAGYHRMLSRLSHRGFGDALKMQALRRGVAVIEVNPAYTSLIGRLKYARQTGFDTHQAAAWVIGRRGMGKKDRLPVLCSVRPATRTRTFIAPEDAREDDPREQKRVGKAFSQWCTTEWAAWRRCQKNWQRPRVLVEADVPL
jgi:IS605 OrfB family transposase